MKFKNFIKIFFQKIKELYRKRFFFSLYEIVLKISNISFLSSYLRILILKFYIITINYTKYVWKKNFYLILTNRVSRLYREEIGQKKNYNFLNFFLKSKLKKLAKKCDIIIIDGTPFHNSFGEQNSNLDLLAKSDQIGYIKDFFGKDYQKIVSNKKLNYVCDIKKSQNKFFLSLWKNYFQIFSNKSKKYKNLISNKRVLYLDPRNIFFKNDIIDIQYCYSEINDDWIKNYKKESLFNLKNLDFSSVKKKFQINDAQKIITIHVPVNPKNENENLRYIKDPKPFFLLQKYLCSKYNVFLIMNDKIYFNNKIFNKNEKDFLFLFSKSTSVISNSSGPNMIPYIFNVRSIWVNMVPFLPAPLSGDLYAFKKIKKYNNNKVNFFLKSSNYLLKKSFKNKVLFEELNFDDLKNIFNESMHSGVKRNQVKFENLRRKYGSMPTSSYISNYFISKYM